MGVNLGGLKISNTEREGFSDEPFVQVENLMIQIPLLTLIKKQPEISKILIKKPQIILEIDSSGHFNYDDLALIPKDKKADEDTVKRVRVRYDRSAGSHHPERVYNSGWGVHL